MLLCFVCGLVFGMCVSFNAPGITKRRNEVNLEEPQNNSYVIHQQVASMALHLALQWKD